MNLYHARGASARSELMTTLTPPEVLNALSFRGGARSDAPPGVLPRVVAIVGHW